jgi:hypothetical protein
MGRIRNGGELPPRTGTAYGELDPDRQQCRHRQPDERRLWTWPRRVRGGVRYLAAGGCRKGNRKILYEVVNGAQKSPPVFMWHETSPTSYNDPVTATDAGTGLTFRAGYTLVWSGNPDAPRANHGLGMRAVATHNGAPIVKTIRDGCLRHAVPTTRLSAPEL